MRGGIPPVQRTYTTACGQMAFEGLDGWLGKQPNDGMASTKLAHTVRAQAIVQLGVHEVAAPRDVVTSPASPTLWTGSAANERREI